MRLPFPERVSVLPVLTFCLLLALAQQLLGTTLLFSAATVLFILLAALAFNICGGFTRPSGGFVFAYSCVGILFGIVYKVVVGEPAQSNLLQPERTIEIYVASMAGMAVAAYLARKMRLKRRFLAQFTSLEEMYRGCVGLLMIGLAIMASEYLRTSPAAPGSALSALYRLDVFLPMAIFLGVTYEVRRSGGRRSVNGAVLLAIGFSFANGLIGYSKEGMLAPFACWLIPAAAQRYRVSILQIAGLLLGFAFTAYYLVPYSQYGRDFRGSGATLSQNLRNNYILLTNLPLVRKIYIQQQAEIYSGDDLVRYYDKPQGLMDRVQMVTPDDAVINLTEQGSVFGIFPTLFSFENLIPHFIWPSKPSIGFGNVYAHELGIIGDDEDNSTGISFSPAGDAFHQARWVGVLIMLPLLALMLFFIADSVCGDTRDSPFTLLLLLLFLHSAPEGGLLQFAPLASATTIQIYIASFLGARVMPVIASIFLGPAKEPRGWAADPWQQMEQYTAPGKSVAAAE